MAAYFHLAVHCDEIYHSRNEQRMSVDARKRCELIMNKRCEAKYLLVTVRGTQTLEDLLTAPMSFVLSHGIPSAEPNRFLEG